MRAPPLKSGVQELEIKRGKKVEEKNTEVEKKSSGGRRGKNRIKSTGAMKGKATDGARQQFYDSGARLKEWRKRRGCMYGERTKRCEFHSISRPLTIERVHSSVCTQNISTESSFVEVLRNAERNLLPSSVPSDPNYPSGLVFPVPAISPWNGVKDFRLRFVAAFISLCSVSSPLDVAFSYRVKKVLVSLLRFFI